MLNCDRDRYEEATGPALNHLNLGTGTDITIAELGAMIAEITGFEGDILVTLDSIAELTLIGFDSEDTHVWSVFNDTTRNSLSAVNVVDCQFKTLEFSW